MIDHYAGYDTRARCARLPAAHCRSLAPLMRGASSTNWSRDGSEPVAKEAIRRFARIYHVEGQFEAMDAQQRLAAAASS